jgi:MFS family permease
MTSFGCTSTSSVDHAFNDETESKGSSLGDTRTPSELLNEPLLSHEQEAPSNRTSVKLNDGKDIVFPCGRLNHNVALNLLLCILYGLSDSLWGGTVIVAFLKRLGHNRNSPVGDVEAASGLAALISALPIGYLADKIGRDKVIRFGGALLFITAVLHVSLLEWIGVDDDAATKKDAFWLLAAVMALWGIGGGIVTGPAQALYADSTPAGSRSTYYVYLFTCYSLASCVGPLVSIVLFQTIGDEWDLYHLRIVLYVGLSFELINAVIMMFFDDTKALDEQKSADCEESEIASPNIEEETDQEQAFPQSLVEQSDAAATLDEPHEDRSRIMVQRRKFIPYINFASQLIFGIASGMTIKFFPLFFKDEVNMSPSQVQLIYVIVPIGIVCCSVIGKKLASTGFGRVQSSLLLMVLGVSALYAMVFLKSYLDVHPFVLVPVYIMRTSLMNAPYPLQESILMDYVPKSERARWKSLDSVSGFGWCGSAALGGWLTDRYDYTFTFLITAMLQTVGILVYALLLPLVPAQEEALRQDANGGVKTRLGEQVSSETLQASQSLCCRSASPPE